MLFRSITRFTLDFLRLDASLVAGININQTVMAVVAVLAAVVLILRHKGWKPETVSEETGEEATLDLDAEEKSGE